MLWTYVNIYFFKGNIHLSITNCFSRSPTCCLSGLHIPLKNRHLRLSPSIFPLCCLLHVPVASRGSPPAGHRHTAKTVIPVSIFFITVNTTVGRLSRIALKTRPSSDFDALSNHKIVPKNLPATYFIRTTVTQYYC